MKVFTKGLKRLIRIRSSDRALGTAEWVLEMDESGVTFHRLGARKDYWSLTWRQIIGHGLIHSAGRKKRIIGSQPSNGKTQCQGPI